MPVSAAQPENQEHLLSGAAPFTDERVRRAISVLDEVQLALQVDTWRQERRNGPGGRPETFPVRALLVAMALLAVCGEPMHLMGVCEVLFGRISPAMRAELGVPLDVEIETSRGRANAYRNVRTRFRALLEVMDPSDAPKNRKLDAEDFLAALGDRQARRTDAERQEAFERLHVFVNLILEASFLMLPREVRRRWKGSLAVDATVVPAFARPEKRSKRVKRGAETELQRSSSDPDAAWYVRTADGEGEPEGDGRREAIKKAVWGYEATLAVSGDVESAEGEVRFPSLVVGMAPLHKPSAQPGANATRALTSVIGRGHPAGYLAADRAYSSSKADDYQLPARALGYQLVMDYKKDQLGVQAEVKGAFQVEGTTYCPAMPPDLVGATSAWRDGRIDEDTYRARIEARQNYETRPKGRPDADGHQRVMCPASGVAPRVRCEIKSAAEVFDGKTRVRIRPSAELKAHPPPICRQHSVTVAPSDGAKFAQPLRYGSDRWRFVYGTLRNSVEGENAYLKDPARQGMEQSGRRRVRGVAAQSVLVAFQIFGANVDKIETYVKVTSDGPILRPRRRRPPRRLTSSLTTWDPRNPTPAPAGQPPPAAA